MSVVNLPDQCTIRMDGELHESRDFVGIISKPDGDTAIFYNTDALTLGMAVKMITREFIRCMTDLSEEQRNDITSILGDAFVTEEAHE